MKKENKNWRWYIIIAVFLWFFLVFGMYAAFGQGNGQPCSNNCTECSGTLTCVSCTCYVHTSIPIELVSFNGYFKDNKNIIKWVTETETNNDYFELYRSLDALNWKFILNVNGQGNSNEIIYYNYIDSEYTKDTINYYKLKQYDFNGQESTFNIIAINNHVDKGKLLNIINILGQEIDSTYPGIKFHRYENGSIIKKF